MNIKATAGFTLLELLVAVTVSALLLTIGIPSFLQMVANNQRVTHTADVYNAFNFARSEAIARNVQVVVCRSSDLQSCGGSGQWSGGWIVYANNDNAITASEPTGGVDEILRTHSGTDRFQLTTATSEFSNRVIYLPSGRTAAMGSFSLCPDETDVAGRTIEITSTGRPRTATLTCSHGDA